MTKSTVEKKRQEKWPIPNYIYKKISPVKLFTSNYLWNFFAQLGNRLALSARLAILANSIMKRVPWVFKASILSRLSSISRQYGLGILIVLLIYICNIYRPMGRARNSRTSLEPPHPWEPLSCYRKRCSIREIGVLTSDCCRLQAAGPYDLKLSTLQI